MNSDKRGYHNAIVPFSYFSLAFGKLSGLNLVIKKPAVDLAK